jgi:hypothetical protein
MRGRRRDRQALFDAGAGALPAGWAPAPPTDADYLHYLVEAKVRDPGPPRGRSERWPVDFGNT